MIPETPTHVRQLDALREILLNAVMHRDYSYYPGYVAIVVFDDRIEIQSYGGLPSVVRLDHLSGPHLSKLRNPLIAGAFHRTGAVECWGRGTNRVIAMCEKHGASPPSFEERQGFLIVTFKAQIVVGAQTAVPEAEPGPESRPTGEVTPQVTAQVTAQVAAYCLSPRTAKEIRTELGLKHWKTFQSNYLLPLMDMGIIERTIPDKPNSRLQKYRLTAKGKAILGRSA